MPILELYYYYIKVYNNIFKYISFYSLQINKPMMLMMMMMMIYNRITLVYIIIMISSSQNNNLSSSSPFIIIKPRMVKKNINIFVRF